MRKIYCSECGKVKPTHPDDAALGYFPRRTHGKTIGSLVCDACGKDMPSGSAVVAESIPNNMAYWESDYLQTADDEAISLSEMDQHQKHDAEPNSRSGLAFTHARIGEP